MEGAESVDYTEYVIIGGVVNFTLVSSALLGFGLKSADVASILVRNLHAWNSRPSVLLRKNERTVKRVIQLKAALRMREAPKAHATARKK